MAVTLTIYDLKQPTGELDESLFPTGNIDSLVAGWLAQAADEVANITAADQDAAARAWVYYRAYSHVAQRLASSPANVVIDSTVTRTTSADQRKYFADLATYWLNFFYSLNITTPSAANPAFFGTVKARRYGSTFCQ